MTNSSEPNFYGDTKNHDRCVLSVNCYARWFTKNIDDKWIEEVPFLIACGGARVPGLTRITADEFHKRTGKDPHVEADRLIEATKKSDERTASDGDTCRHSMHDETPEEFEYPWIDCAIAMTPDALELAVRELGKRITRDYAEFPSITLACVLKGGFVFAADLIRHIEHPALDVEFLEVDSGRNELPAETLANLRGKHVIVLDDICDTGETLSKAVTLVETAEPMSVRIALAVLRIVQLPLWWCLDMPRDANSGGYFHLVRSDQRMLKVHYPLCGISGDDPLFGYGIDLDGRERGLPFVASPANELHDKGEEQLSSSSTQTRLYVPYRGQYGDYEDAAVVAVRTAGNTLGHLIYAIRCDANPEFEGNWDQVFGEVDGCIASRREIAPEEWLAITSEDFRETISPENVRLHHEDFLARFPDARSA